MQAGAGCAVGGGPPRRPGEVRHPASMDSVGISLADICNNPKYDFLNSLKVDNQPTNFDFLSTDDLDSPYLNNKFLFSYRDEADFCSTYKNCNSLSILSINIQSLPAKFDDLKSFISNLSINKCNPDIICLQEIWFVSDPMLFSLQGYQPLISSCRQKAQGGGVGFYIKDSINFNISKKSIFVEKVFESQFIEIKPPSSKSFILGNVYRSNANHPTLSSREQFDLFLEYLNTSLMEFNSDRGDLLLAGDFNLDVLKYQNCKLTATYVDTLFLNGLLQCVTKPTRLTHSSATCIDHFITNFTQDSYDVCAILSPLSDHLPLVYFKSNVPSPHIYEPPVYRDFSENNINLFARLLNDLTWNDIIQESDPNVALNSFFDKYFLLYDNIFTPKKI